MGDGFYDYLLRKNQEEMVVKPNTSPSVVEDEAIGTPWTHKFTVYCANPSESFLEELKSKDGVVAVYVKEKENTSPSDKESAPSNDK